MLILSFRAPSLSSPTHQPAAGQAPLPLLTQITRSKPVPVVVRAMPGDPPPPLTITRRLTAADFDAGFLPLLAQLSEVGEVDRTAFEGGAEHACVKRRGARGRWEGRACVFFLPTTTHNPLSRGNHSNKIG